jgi:hypothetical protein
MTTAPRIVPTVSRTLQSLDLAGWRPRLFVDEATESIEGDYETTLRSPRIGAWPNWWLGMAELYQRQPRADAYVMFEDDLVIAPHSREYIEAIWDRLPPRFGFLNLFVAGCRMHRLGAEHRQLQVVPKTSVGIGALALVFPNDALRAMLTSRYLLHHRRTLYGLKNQDGAMRRWAQRGSWPEVLHHPSLVQHTGSSIVRDTEGRRTRNSTLDNGWRSASALSRSFVGEDFDARLLLEEA